MQKIKEFWQKYETKIVLAIGFILIAVISFEGGYLQGKNQKESPIMLERASECPKNEAGSPNLQENREKADIQKTGLPGDLKTSQADCAFVGSKNSNKYHSPTCRFAKNIKPENLVCFKNAEEATQKNYQPDKTCIK